MLCRAALLATLKLILMNLIQFSKYQQSSGNFFLLNDSYFNLISSWIKFSLKLPEQFAVASASAFAPAFA